MMRTSRWQHRCGVLPQQPREPKRDWLIILRAVRPIHGETACAVSLLMGTTQQEQFREPPHHVRFTWLKGEAEG